MSTPLTKEEILRKYNLHDFKELGDKVNNCITTYSATFASMDEYAKQQSIAFANWYVKEGWESSTVNRELWFNMDYEERLSTEQLYNLFVESNKQP